MGIPDETYFGEKPDGGAIVYGEVRRIQDDQTRLKILKKRLDVLLIEQVGELSKRSNDLKRVVWSPFPLCILTLLCIETLGRVIGDVQAVSSEGPHEVSKKLASPIMHLMDYKLSYCPTKAFRQGFEQIHGTQDRKSIRKYLDIIHKYQRNTFNHGYQAKGVYLDHKLVEMWIINENAGYLVLNPYLFWDRFVQVYEMIFSEILHGYNKEYRRNALNYFHSLID